MKKLSYDLLIEEIINSALEQRNPSPKLVRALNRYLNATGHSEKLK